MARKIMLRCRIRTGARSGGDEAVADAVPRPGLEHRQDIGVADRRLAQVEVASRRLSWMTSGQKPQMASRAGPSGIEKDRQPP